MTMPLEEHEVEVGLVLHLDPDALREEGAEVHHLGKFRQGPLKRRYYVCVAKDGERSAWCPMYGRGHSSSRITIKPKHKRGPDYFTGGTHNIDSGTVFICNLVQLVVGLRAGRDRAHPSNRPHIVPEGLPTTAKTSGELMLRGETPQIQNISIEDELLQAAEAKGIPVADEIVLGEPTPCVLPGPPPGPPPEEPQAPAEATDAERRARVKAALRGLPQPVSEALDAARFALEKIGCQHFRCPGPSSKGPEVEICPTCVALKKINEAHTKGRSRAHG